MTHVLGNGQRDLLGTGYSGHGPGLDNPALQTRHDEGPIPQGNWTIGPERPHAHLPGGAMPLAPGPGNTTSRTGFLIHGDNRQANHTASKGCIVLPPRARNAIAHSTDRRLKVIK